MNGRLGQASLPRMQVAQKYLVHDRRSRPPDFCWPGRTGFISCSAPMEPELQKAVDAGKLSAQHAKVLALLRPGSYCLHKSWGFGRVDAISLLVNQLTVDFKGRKGHTMQLDYAAQSLQPLPPDHILARKAADLPAVKNQAREQPAELVRIILESHGGKASQDQIANALVPDLFSEQEFKRWWENTKKLLKKDGHFVLPAKRGAPLELREHVVSHSEELLAAFFNARQLKEQIGAADQLVRNTGDFTDPARLAPVVLALEQSALQNQRLHTAQALELLLARDELCERAPDLKKNPPAIADILRNEEGRLAEVLANVPALKQKRLLAHLPEVFGDAWVSKSLRLMLHSNARLISELARLFEERGKRDELHNAVDRLIREHSISPELLFWLCKERTGSFADLVGPQVFGAIISALERDQLMEKKRGSRLHDLLLEDRELIGDLISSDEPGVVRDALRKLLLTPVFDELNKRSLLGRIIRLHPEMQSMISGEAERPQEALIVSWESLERRKAEYEELVSRKIPQNTEEIRIARSYGDLRENFEYKAAKDMQRVLMRRKAEMEQGLSRARGTDFENVDTTQVSIGAVVTLRDINDGSLETYSILGAWDSDPAKGIISYHASIGQSLLGHKAGDVIDLPTEHGTRRAEIVEISGYRATATATQ
jgi:transcription elongation GreA/GreB family factor